MIAQGEYALFATIALAAETSAEKLLESAKDETESKVAEKLYKQFGALRDKAENQSEFDFGDWSMLLAAMSIASAGLRNSIETSKRVLQDYETVWIPKVREIVSDKEHFKEISQKVFESDT